MSKKHFIALADMIKRHNVQGDSLAGPSTPFTQDQLNALALFCESQNPRFLPHRWLAYIAGECGPNGGQIK